MLRVGILSTAHLHVHAYVHGLPAGSLVGFWEDDEARAAAFAATGLPRFADPESLLAACDAALVCSENVRHADLVTRAAEAGRPVLCEKPLGVSEGDFAALEAAAARVPVMTAFPCRFGPAYRELRARVQAGEIGDVRAICATNRGRCPGGWFTDPALSGGGAMMDHTVHVADLLRDLLGEEPTGVLARTGNLASRADWDDSALLTLDHASGVFATLDSSWSRPPTYRGWGDVTMNVVGDRGVLELDLFGQAMQLYAGGSPSHTEQGFGPDLDAAMIAHFLRVAETGDEPETSAAHGIAAARVALAGYRSLASGRPEAPRPS